MEGAASYEKLKVFQLAHQLALEVYQAVGGFPSSERFRLADQLCRAVVSIPANIAEGHGRYHQKELAHFLYIARGSVEETKYYLMLAKDLGYLTFEAYSNLRAKAAEVGKMLNGLIARSKQPLADRRAES